MRLLLALLLLAAPLAAQADFLTNDEADQLRLAQEPDVRLQLYLRFARQRVDLLDQLFSQKKTGRSGMIHDTLEQFTQIVEAIDNNIDDAIRRQKPITSLGAVAKAEREMLANLEKFAVIEAADKNRYQFALEQAIETIRDSAELSEQDLRERTHSVEQREVDIRKEREALATPERKEEMQKEKAKIEAEKQGVAPGKKRPSLYKPGEKGGGKGGEKTGEKAPAAAPAKK
jgi:hypothetical protein